MILSRLESLMSWAWELIYHGGRQSWLSISLGEISCEGDTVDLWSEQCRAREEYEIFFDGLEDVAEASL